MAHDASHYLLTPSAVVIPRDAAQVAALLRLSVEHGVALTFRSGGTSLSGQAVTENLLVDTRRHFRDVQVLDDGMRVRVQPGVTLRQVNNRLAPYGRRLGPDPASESACTVGGIIANNSSGMTCGTERNTYRTVESLVLALPSGTMIDTGAADADERLRALEPDLFAGLARLRNRIRGNPESVRLINAQFAMKNTMGYGLNAFLDHSSPSQILAHLVVGSEGTLAFVAEATFRTVPTHPHAATGLLVFPTLRQAMAAMPALVAAEPAAVEVLDAAALRVAQLDPQADEAMRGLQVTEQAALLVEWQAADAETLDAQVHGGVPVLADLPLSAPARLTASEGPVRAVAHPQGSVRRGRRRPSVRHDGIAGGHRRAGARARADPATTSPGCSSGTATGTASIFGHAKDGNLHFMLTEEFRTGEAPDRYAAFTRTWWTWCWPRAAR